MPAGLGDIMVVVRAQDFASRTLRRVSGELAGMSRQQQLAYQGQLLGLQKMQAAAKMDLALSNQRALSMIKMKGGLAEQQKAIERYNQAQIAASRRDPVTGRYRRVPASAMRELQTAERAMAKYGVTAGNAATRLANVRLAGQKLDDAIATLPPRFRRLTVGTAEFSRALSQMKIELAAAGMAARDVEIAEIAMANALKAAPIQRLHDISAALGGIGRTMQLWGAVGTGIFVLSGAAAANFSRQVTLAATQTRKAGASFTETAKNADVLQRSILDMMTQFPASAEDMSKAAYDIYSSMDVSFGAGQKLLRLFNKAAVAGQVDLATATSASISVLESFDNRLREDGKVTARTTQLMNLMFATVRYGRMNFAQFNQMLSSVVPAALNAGQSLDDVAGAMALMTRHVPSQSRAATYLARTLQVLTWRDFQKGMRAFGKPIADAEGHLYDFMTVMGRVHAVADSLGVDFNQLIPIITRVGSGFKTQGREGTQMARYGLGLLVRYYEELQTVQGNVLTDTDEFNKAYKAMASTLGVRWQVMLNQYKVLILTIGEQALPVLISIGEHITELIEKWQGLSEGTRKWIVQALTVISVATLLSGIFLAVVSVLSGIAAGFLNLFKTFGGPGVENTLLGRAGLFLTTMKGIAGIGAIVIGIDLMFSEHGNKALGAIATAIGIGILGGERFAIPAVSIAIAFELFRKGGEWQHLGALVAALGIFGMRGGIGRTMRVGSIALGLSLIPEGSMWTKLVGAILLGAAAGWPLAAITIPVTIALTMSQGDDVWQKTWNAFETNYKRMQDATAQGIPIPQKLKDALAILPPHPTVEQLKAFNAVADQWYKNWKAKVKAVEQLWGHKPPKTEIPDAAPSLREVIRLQKVETINQALVNQLLKQANQDMQDIASSAEVAATKIAAAFTQGKLAQANKLVAQFLVTSKGVPLTWANIASEVSKAMNMKGGGIQAAAAVLQQFVEETQQAQKQYEQDMKQWTEDMKQWNENLKNTMQDAATTTMNTLRGLYQQITQQNEALMGDLFKGPWLTSQTFDLAQEWGIKPRVEDMIRDMKEQAGQFTQIRNLYAGALRKKLPKGFLDEIMKMAPDQALGFLQQLATATPAQVQQIISLWAKRKNAIKQASKVDFKDSISAYRKAGVDMATAMINGFSDIAPGKWFDGWIKKQFPNLIDAAVNQAVAKWKKENPVPKKPTGVAGGGGEAPTAPPPQGGKAQPPPGRSQMPMGDTSKVPVKAPKVPPPVVNYGAYKKAGIQMGNSIVAGFNSAHVARRTQIDFVPEIIRYHGNGKAMGNALGKGIILSWQKQIPVIERDLQQVNFNESTIAFHDAGKRLGNAFILGFRHAKVGHYFRTWINETFPKLIDAAVTEAVTKWKKEHKDEVKPGKAGGTTNNTTNNTSTDNRIIITVPDSVGPHVKTNARYVAWLAKHHIRPNQVQNV